MHFYDNDGNPMYEVPYADKARAGEMRKATVADARKHGWRVGVTDILGVVNDPGLTWWKIQTHIEAALTEPRDGRALDDMLPSIRANAEEFAKVARDKGVAIHDAIERYVRWAAFDGASPIDLTGPLVPAATMGEFIAWYADHECQPDPDGVERSFSCDSGYGGRIDYVGHIAGMLAVADWKTQATKPGQPFKFYPKWGAQLAAYAYGTGHRIDHVNLVNVVLSTTEPGRIDYKIWPNNRELLCAFFSAFDLFKGPLGSNYNPCSLD